MKAFRISEFGVRIWAVAALLEAATLGAIPTPTPTPRPRLTGGFGRPREITPVPPEGGQTMADVVRAAHDRKDSEKTEKGAVTIDNRSLVTNPDKGRVSTSRMTAPKPTPTLAPNPAAPRAAAPEPAGQASAESPTGGTEAEWREIARKARQRVEDDKARVAELDAAARKLENDFYAWDDGQYRDRVIKPSWDKTREQLEAARLELSEAERELADLPEKARRAGALPGWIRE